MLYCVSDASCPVEYLSSGNLVCDNGFLHERRFIDSFVFIIVRKGILHITQNEINYDVHENEALILFPNMVHYGYKRSEGYLSYYWTHFYITDPDYRIYNRNSLLRYNTFLFDEFPNSVHTNTATKEFIILPEFSKLSAEKRSILLFSQLLDISKRNTYQQTWRCHYALSLLLTEFTAEYLSISDLIDNHLPSNVKAIIEWIRVHYAEDITVAYLAKQFNYHPTYLTALMKKYTKHTVSYYITYFRISAAKNLLVATSKPKMTVKETAYMCGFKDEKYFMRIFKNMEGVTPEQYRNAFNEKKLTLK